MPIEVLTRRKSKAGRILLPYQEAWRRDANPMKIWEKSRRIGATYAEANDVVFTRLGGRKVDYWFTSADESAAYEFAEYNRFWLSVAHAVADSFEEDIEDPVTGKTARAFCVRFPNGARMTAMTSNPRRFRSKGGDVGLDEYAYHDKPGAMYDAAEACTMWGGWLRILSTHNGEGSEFNKFCQMGHRHARGEAKPSDIPFSILRVTLPDAVRQGLVERINEVAGTEYTREEFLKERRSRCRNLDQWNQEYMAIPSTDTTAWLPYELIEGCEDDKAGNAAFAGDGQRYIGMDVGETTDLTTVWTLERVGDVLWTRELVVFTDEPLSVKQDALIARIKHPRVVRACIDGTGVGAQIAQAAARTGKGESVKFSLSVKDELASPLRGLFEDKRIRIPGSAEIREDLHAVRMTRTASGNIRFDAERSQAGHADRFWALALACHAAKTAVRGHLWVA